MPRATLPPIFGKRPLALCSSRLSPLLSIKFQNGPAGTDGQNSLLATCVLARRRRLVPRIAHHLRSHGTPGQAAVCAGQNRINTGRDNLSIGRGDNTDENCGGTAVKGPPCRAAVRSAENRSALSDGISLAVISQKQSK